MGDFFDSLPPSAVPWRVACAGLCGFVVGLAGAWAIRDWPVLSLMLLMVCTAMPMWWLEWRRARVCVDAQASPAAKPSGRCRARFYGLVIAALLWAVTLNVLPLASGSVLDGFWQVVVVVWPLLLMGAFLYVLHPSHQPSGLERIGCWLMLPRRGGRFPWAVLRDQLVKAFFLPLMIAFAYDWVVQADPLNAVSRPAWYFIAVALLYLVDTVFGAIGYLSTFRRLDAHIRSSNPYWSGWCAALICYPPFFTWLQQAGFNYRDGKLWLDWLQSSQFLFQLWGGVIVLLTAIYALSTVVFGIRFSNLTHRGIITHGPYRWTKHPAYISKNLSWWMVSVPFVSSVDVRAAIFHCLVLLCINGIYWCRARTEERHLMADPDYRAYSAWIARHGVFARLRQLLWWSRR